MAQPGDEAFRSLVERAADVILLLDADGAISYANPAAEELFGRPRCELVGEQFGSVATSEQRSEIYVLHPRREVVAANIRRAPVEVDDDPHMAVYLRDVTERVREEERLRQFAVIFDAISDGVIITRPDSAVSTASCTRPRRPDAIALCNPDAEHRKRTPSAGGQIMSKKATDREVSGIETASRWN